jgi:hypothetical protein
MKQTFARALMPSALCAMWLCSAGAPTQALAQEPAKPANPAANAPASPAPADTAKTKPAAPPARGSDPKKPADTSSSSDTSRTAPQGKAMDHLELDSTAITGNRELPKVLYIVPWKKPDLGELAGRPANSLLDEVLAPVDREVFRRQTDYFATLNADPAEQSAEKPAVENSKEPQ